jgi:Tol biopolymer transport system component
MNSSSRLVGLAVLTGVLVAVLLPSLSQARSSSRSGEIAFSTPVNGVNQVFTVHPDGTGLRQITHGATEAGQFGLAWSPDGSHLLFSVTNQGIVQIARSRANGSGLTVISPPCIGTCLGDGDAVYSPDGEKIAFDRQLAVGSDNQLPAIFTMNADRSDPRQLTQRPTPTTAGDIEPQWSPNGRRIAIHRFYPPSFNGVIELIKADGSNVRRLTPLRIDATNPRWSPNGKRLLFNTYNQAVPGKSANLFTIHPDGTHRVALTHYAGGTLQAFAQDWSPDGKHIIYSRLRFVSGHAVGGFYIIDRHGKHKRRLTSIRITEDSRAAWGK